jgi:hypothetical protein
MGMSRIGVKLELDSGKTAIAHHEEHIPVKAMCIATRSLSGIEVLGTQKTV